uniref:Uncharacterized protein n=1 Tax=Gossypium raimondii TaxID=29730 RepID=A0A0D2NPC5_GOSRA|nr:hypothetical protein B456_002G175800 [Gossypium raimondii]
MFDPRRKIRYEQFAFLKMDSRDQTNALMKKLNVALADFFNEYKPLSHHQVEQVEKSGQSSRSSLTPKLVQALFCTQDWLCN